MDAYRRNRTPVPDDICKQARLCPSFLPETGTESRALALHILTTGEGNKICVYHIFKDRNNNMRDGWGPTGGLIHTIPAKRKASSTKDRVKTICVAPKGFFNCGCPTDDVLLYFYWTKTLTVHGRVKGNYLTEKMLARDYITPRARGFFITAFRAWRPTIGINDLYRNGSTEDEYNIGLRLKEANAHLQSLNIEILRQGGDDSDKFRLVKEEDYQRLQEQMTAAAAAESK